MHTDPPIQHTDRDMHVTHSYTQPTNRNTCARISVHTVHSCTHMYTRVDTTPNHMHMQSGMRTLKCVHAHACTHNTHVHTHRRTHAYVCSHTCTNTYAHSHALVCTQSRMHQPHTCPHPPAASHTGTLRHTGAHPPASQTRAPGGHPPVSSCSHSR